VLEAWRMESPRIRFRLAPATADAAYAFVKESGKGPGLVSGSSEDKSSTRKSFDGGMAPPGRWSLRETCTGRAEVRCIWTFKEASWSVA